MAGAYAAIASVLLGGGLELAMNGPTGYLYHPVVLYGYAAAWLAALGIGYNTTFFPTHPREGLLARNPRQLAFLGRGATC